MTLKELFQSDKITLDMVEDCAEISSYWAGAANFVIENWNADIEDLSSKQYQWAHRILEDLVEWRIEGKWD